MIVLSSEYHCFERCLGVGWGGHGCKQTQEDELAQQFEFHVYELRLFFCS